MTSNRKDIEDIGFERIGHWPRPGTLRAKLANQLLTRLSFGTSPSAPDSGVKIGRRLAR